MRSGVCNWILGEGRASVTTFLDVTGVGGIDSLATSSEVYSLRAPMDAYQMTIEEAEADAATLAAGDRLFLMQVTGSSRPTVGHGQYGF